jgi:hypothetical protein
MNRDAFRFFKAGTAGHVRTGIQLVRLATGQPLPASELLCYRVTAKRLTTPWFKIDFLTGCRLFLAEDAAAELLAAGMIEKTFDEFLLKHLGGHETPETRPWAEANDRARKRISRDKQAAPGTAKPAGGKVKPQAEPSARPRNR